MYILLPALTITCEGHLQKDGLNLSTSCLLNLKSIFMIVTNVPYLQVYDGDPRKAGRVAKWLGFAEKFLPPIKLSDGRQVEREVEAWLPKKKVKAHSLTCVDPLEF